MRDLLTLREAAVILKVSYMTALTYAKNGTLKAVMIGGRWRVRSEDLDELAKKGSPPDESDVAVEISQEELNEHE